MARYAFASLAFVAAACVRPATGPAPPNAPPQAAVDTSSRREQAVVELRLRLPVEGAWIVSQGYHGAETHQGRAAYALDLVKVDDEGRAYLRNGGRTQDWFGFGADVLASADGEVVRAIDRYADNRVWGKGKDANTVIVRHDALFSEYVHLRQGSLRVRVGDQVKRGQVLARCGNAGSETPHVHWAVLSSLEPIRTQPAMLEDYEARDAAGQWHAASGAPSVGTVLRNATTGAP